MSKRMFAQLCATLVFALLAVLFGRGMHDIGGVIVFAVCVLATIVSAFRVRSLRAKDIAARRRVPQNAATDRDGRPSGSIR